MAYYVLISSPSFSENPYDTNVFNLVLLSIIPQNSLFNPSEFDSGVDSMLTVGFRPKGLLNIEEERYEYQSVLS